MGKDIIIDINREKTAQRIANKIVAATVGLGEANALLPTILMPDSVSDPRLVNAIDSAVADGASIIGTPIALGQQLKFRRPRLFSGAMGDALATAFVDFVEASALMRWFDAAGQKELMLHYENSTKLASATLKRLSLGRTRRGGHIKLPSK